MRRSSVLGFGRYETHLMKQGKSHIDFLDYLRGIAIVMVYLFHTLGEAYREGQLPWTGCFRSLQVSWTFLLLSPTTMGWLGVAVFFALSGFCIHYSYERGARKGIGEFYIRRIFRLYPPYLIALLIFAFAYPWHKVHFNGLLSIADFWSHIFLIHNIDGRFLYGINPAFWSIAIEFQLYLIYPALLFIVRRTGWRNSLILLGLFEIGMRVIAGIWAVSYTPTSTNWFTFSPFYFWFSWAIGAALADAYLKEKPLPFAQSSTLLWVVLTILSLLVKPLLPLAFPFAALATTTAIAGQLVRPRLFTLPGLGYLRFVGITSYSIYLLHQPILGLVPRMIGRFAPALATHHTFVYFVCILMWFPIVWISRLFYRLVELPSIEVGKWCIRKYGSRQMVAFE